MTDRPGKQAAAALLAWFEARQRALPWRAAPAGRREPYEVWVSEIMLQQTRVDVVVPYFEAWMKRFPAVETLAEASEDEVLRHYQEGRPIQWGAFTSTTTSLQSARSFTSRANGVIFKIKVLSGKDICALSFFRAEDEVLLSPNHKFIVTSATGGYVEDDFAMVDLLETRGDWFHA